jgi:FAD/FMN-containing dehydrogenase
MTATAPSPLEPADVDPLRAAVRGGVVAPGDDAYNSACALWNGVIVRRPALFARCTGTADVIAALRFARERGLPVSVRGGGHNVAGSALCDGGVVIDLSPLSGVRVDASRRTVRAGGGARLGDLDHETQGFGLAVPVGVVSRTGIAGLTLHGGYGFLTRRLGLTCDSLVAADVVTADGEVLHVDEEAHPDLLWALRGGGGNFGVVTSFEYRAHPVGPEVYMAITLYPLADAPEAIRVFRDLMAGAPEELMGVGVLWSAPEEEFIPEHWRGQPVFIPAACWSGPLEQGEDIVRPLREIAPPVADLSGPMPYLAAQQLFDPDYPDGGRYYWKSIYLRDLDDATIEALIRHAAGRPSSHTTLDIWALGGAARREPAGGSAFTRREDPFLLGIEANWTAPEDDDANIAWAREVFRDMARYSPGGAYLNFPGFGEEGESLLRASFGPSYDRLRELKRRYDPDNVFRSNLNIVA